MELIVVLIILVIILIIGVFIFEINIKKLKEAGNNKECDEIVSKFPENKKICEEILEKLDNKKVKIKENDDKTASLYIAITDTIFIANISKTYTRIQTIAHECLHSIQNKKMLIFNYIFSNIYILYFILSIVLTIFNVFKNYELQIIILSVFGFLYYAVRAYLETDAMTKAKYLAEEYMKSYSEKNNICEKEEIEKVVNEYKKINEIGIPATNYILFANCVAKVIIYIVVAICKTFF